VFPFRGDTKSTQMFCEHYSSMWVSTLVWRVTSGFDNQRFSFACFFLRACSEEQLSSEVDCPQRTFSFCVDCITSQAARQPGSQAAGLPLFGGYRAGLTTCVFPLHVFCSCELVHKNSLAVKSVLTAHREHLAFAWTGLRARQPGSQAARQPVHNNIIKQSLTSTAQRVFAFRDRHVHLGKQESLLAKYSCWSLCRARF